MAKSAAGERWTVVLSGGEGERLRAWVEALFGEARPKQYCAFLDGRTMLEHALERARGLSDPGRIVTVIGNGHRRHLASPRPIAVPGRLVEQPANRDTVAGILLPLAHVLAADPDASVAVLPSDHHIAPTGRFLEHMDRAFRLAEGLERMIVLMGAVPDRPETDYGWIELSGKAVGGDPSGRVVRRFHEKPRREEAEVFLREGWLWNTFVLVAKARTLWSLAVECLPGVGARFEALRRAVGTPHESAVLAWAYAAMPAENFSSSVLQACPGRSLVVGLEGVEWSDWGRPERVEESLRRAGVPAPLPRAGVGGAR